MFFLNIKNPHALTRADDHKTLSVIWRPLDRNNKQLTCKSCIIIRSENLINIQMGEVHTSSLWPWNHHLGLSHENGELPFHPISTQEASSTHTHADTHTSF